MTLHSKNAHAIKAADAGLPDINRREPHQAGQSPALQKSLWGMTAWQEFAPAEGSLDERTDPLGFLIWKARLAKEDAVEGEGASSCGGYDQASQA
jgi:hypothetical protein